MRIYEIATGYTPVPAKMGAATEIVVEELVKAFEKMGENVILVDIQNEDGNHGCKRVVEVPVPRKYRTTDVSLGLAHKLKRVVYSISLAMTLKKELKSITDTECVLHFHNQYNCFFFFLLTSKKIRKRVTIAYTNHSYVWQGDWNDIKGSIKKRYFQECYCLRHADKIFVLNKTISKNIIEHANVSKGNVYQVINGVNGNVYYPLSEEDKGKIRNKMGLNFKRIYGQIGSVCERKNQLESIKALTPILKLDINTIFCFAGGIISQDYFDKIIAYSEAEGIKNQVIYLGELEPGEKLNGIYNLCDAMILPSKQEAFSLVINEAAAAGTPTLINSRLDFETINFCIRFDGGDDLLDKLKGLSISSETCRKEVLDKYGWDTVAKIYLDGFLNYKMH